MSSDSAKPPSNHGHHCCRPRRGRSRSAIDFQFLPNPTQQHMSEEDLRMGTGLSKHNNESYVGNQNVTSHTVTAMKRHTNPFLLSASQPRRERIFETTVLSLFFYGLPNSCAQPDGQRDFISLNGCVIPTQHILRTVQIDSKCASLNGGMSETAQREVDFCNAEDTDFLH